MRFDITEHGREITVAVVVAAALLVLAIFLTACGPPGPSQAERAMGEDAACAAETNRTAVCVTRSGAVFLCVRRFRDDSMICAPLHDDPACVDIRGALPEAYPNTAPRPSVQAL